MGISLHIRISKSVQKKEWESVYEETLQLVKAFPLADKRKMNCRGIDTICLVPTEEKEEAYGWNYDKKRIAWSAVGDYETMHTAERYYLSRDIIEDEKFEADAGDALLGVLPAYLNYDWEDSLCSHTYSIWGAKTQGEPYHIYLLAIACLIESRLKNKAFVYGDITKGQCEHAVELANKYLKESIDIPDRCDLERLWKRVTDLPLAESEKLSVFENFYLGTKETEFGEYIRNLSSKTILDVYWREEFKNVSIGTYGFGEVIKKYLLWGFDLKELCTFVDYNDKDNNPQYEKFVKIIMDSKLHVQEKNCDDVLEIDQEDSQPYSIYTLMAQFVFMGARNPKINRYIPIEDIRDALKSGIPECSNIDLVIDEYLEKEISVPAESENKINEEDASEVLREFMDIQRQRLIDTKKKYDVSEYEELMYYEKGDSIHPQLKESLLKSFEFYNNVLEEKQYKKLMEKSEVIRCEWLIEQNRMLLIRDKDWDKIFKDIQENEDSYARYYPMVRIDLTSQNLVYLTMAIVLNDELYDFCKEHTAELEKGKQ